MITASDVALAFLAYSFIGWLVEGTSRCLVERRLVNPGFLKGPFVPIYGVGAVAISALTQGVLDDPVLVFSAGLLVATVVEFVGHVLLQRSLGLMLWDYSNRFGNLQGRVCLGNSIGLGVGGLIVVYGINPLLRQGLDILDPSLAIGLASALMAAVTVDWFRSMSAVLRLRPQIQSVEGSLARVRHRLESQLEDLGAEYDRRTARLLNRSHRVLTRLESAFPGARTVTNGDPAGTVIEKTSKLPVEHRIEQRSASRTERP